MKKLNYFFILLFSTFIFGLSSCSSDNEPQAPVANKYFVEVINKKTLTKKDIQQYVNTLISNPPTWINTLIATTYNIDVVAINYRTTNVDGTPIIASGIIAMPIGTTSYDNLLSIQHKTISMEDAPSKAMWDVEVAPALFGRVVVMADNLGYGTSENAQKLTPFFHIKYTGIPCADMIEAAREYLKSVGIKEKSDKVELIGYSQGGQATLATLLELEKRGEESRVLAVHVGGLLFDMPATLKTLLDKGSSSYIHSEFIPLVLRGLAYGENITYKAENIFAPETLEKSYIFTSIPILKWGKILGPDLTKIFHSDFYSYPNDAVNEDIPKIMKAFQDNSFSNYNAPINHVNIYHSKDDDYIPYEANIPIAKEKWPNCTFKELNGTHIEAGIEFFLSVMGFNSLINK